MNTPVLYSCARMGQEFRDGNYIDKIEQLAYTEANIMATDDLRAERLKKLELMRQAEVEPYPAESERNQSLVALLMIQ